MGKYLDMGYLEGSGYCKRKEYRKGKSERLPAEVLGVDEVYLFMVAYQNHQKGEEACRAFARVNKVEKTGNGDLSTVRFQLVTTDGAPYSTYTADFSDGYWYKPWEQFKTVAGAYFRYGDKGWDGKLSRLLEEAAIPQAAGEAVVHATQAGDIAQHG